MFSAFFVVRGIGQIALGEMSDRVGRDAALGVSMLAGAVGILLLIFGPPIVAITIAVLCTGIGSSFFSALDPRFLDQLSEAERGAGFGLVRTVYTMLGASGSVSVGLLTDLFSWEVSFAVLGTLFLLNFVAIMANMVLGMEY